jgi:hypothetical protein
MSIDQRKIQRELSRWSILLTLYNSRPIFAQEEMILTVVRAVYPECTRREVINEMDYLHGRDLIEMKKQPDGRYHAHILRYGVDIVEYTVDCEPGIARPEKYGNE